MEQVLPEVHRPTVVLEVTRRSPELVQRPSQHTVELEVVPATASSELRQLAVLGVRTLRTSTVVLAERQPLDSTKHPVVEVPEELHPLETLVELHPLVVEVLPL